MMASIYKLIETSQDAHILSRFAYTCARLDLTIKLSDVHSLDKLNCSATLLYVERLKQEIDKFKLDTYTNLDVI
jgi:hypothetical protein